MTFQLLEPREKELLKNIKPKAPDILFLGGFLLLLYNFAFEPECEITNVWTGSSSCGPSDTLTFWGGAMVIVGAYLMFKKYLER